MKHLILISLILIGCNKYENDFKPYSVKSHRSGAHVTKSNNSVVGQAYFTNSCEYVLTENIGQINKLIGLCDGMTGVHKNSIRIGWEYDKVFKLYSYYYIDGIRGHDYITSVETNEVFSFDVRINKDSYYLSINENVVVIPHNISKVSAWQLYPYFGGDAKNPNDNDMVIMIKTI